MADPVPAPVVDIEDWSEFVKYANDVSGVGRPTDVAHIFRGHSNHLWRLLPSFSRAMISASVAAQRALEIEERGLSIFQRQAHLHIDDDFMRDEDTPLTWWTLMQHHRAPTRILDWTKSPYVAGYFAVQASLDAAGAETPGMVWVAHVRTIRDYCRARYGRSGISEGDFVGRATQHDAEPVLYVVRRPRESERMVAQQGVFSVSEQILADHGQVISDAMAWAGHDNDEPQFFGIRIAPQLKTDFLRRLRTMNVTAASLFPGVDGLGMAVAEAMRLEANYTS